MNKLKLHKLKELDSVAFFQPKKFSFWRALITAFIVLCILGHWLELGYCVIMDNIFGIVADDYVVWTDPWYHPYWVYGFGAAIASIFFEPLKEIIIRHRKTSIGAIVETFLLGVLLAAVLETVFGLMINQPVDGVYPFWDNSQLPFNILGQGWLVNDIFIGFGMTVYVWIVFPLICEMYNHLNGDKANIVFVLVVAMFSICCILSYSQLIQAGIL